MVFYNQKLKISLIFLIMSEKFQILLWLWLTLSRRMNNIRLILKERERKSDHILLYLKRTKNSI